jgi:hypothetical protein
VILTFEEMLSGSIEDMLKLPVLCIICPLPPNIKGTSMGIFTRAELRMIELGAFMVMLFDPPIVIPVAAVDDMLLRVPIFITKELGVVREFEVVVMLCVAMVTTEENKEMVFEFKERPFEVPKIEFVVVPNCKGMFTGTDTEVPLREMPDGEAMANPDDVPDSVAADPFGTPKDKGTTAGMKILPVAGTANRTEVLLAIDRPCAPPYNCCPPPLPFRVMGDPLDITTPLPDTLGEICKSPAGARMRLPFNGVRVLPPK